MSLSDSDEAELEIPTGDLADLDKAEKSGILDDAALDKAEKDGILDEKEGTFGSN